MWSAERLCINAEQWYALFLEARSEDGVKEAEFIKIQIRKHMKTAKRVLDVPCGTGRVSIPLAKMGFDVTGIDISKNYIAIANKKAKMNNVGKRVKFIQGNMRNVEEICSPLERFDACANVFTSIGYGTKEEDITFFKSLRKITKRGGLFFILATQNKNALTPQKPYEGLERVGNIVLIDAAHFDKKTSHRTSNWRFYKDNGKTLKLLYAQKFDVLLYSAQEVGTMLEKSGWKVISVFNADKKRLPLTKFDRRFNIVAKAV